jgi:hypothetical protein
MHNFKEHKEHTKSVLFLESEKVTTPRMQHLEDVVFNRGFVGAKQALRVLNSMKERLTGTDLVNKEETMTLSENISKAKRLLSDINSLTLNRISTTEIVKNQFKLFTSQKSSKLSDKNITSVFMKWVEQSLNARILQSKRPSTKHRRQIEKNEILRFYRTRTKELSLIFEFLSLIIEAKTTIVRKLKNVKDDDLLSKVEEGIVVIDTVTKSSISLFENLYFDGLKTNE